MPTASLPQIVCPKCGTRYDSDLTGCGHCGAAKPTNPMLVARTSPALPSAQPSGVVIVGVDIPFGKLVGNLVLLTLAAIPAAIIAAFILALGSALLAGVVGGLVRGLTR